MDKKSKGLLFTISGMVFTSIGMVLLVMQKPAWIYISCCIIGVFLALVGLIKIVHDNQKKI
ncbi:hypothetical protein [uncultured Croceitalea sp.]|uniref:hypothetical protein n=1 Tax=uncultured Croceitalea sp. TaxID=1798908 RepID=UPI00374FAD55